MIFHLEITFVAVLLSLHFAMSAFCSNSEGESGTLIRMHRHPHLQRMVRDHHLKTAKAHSNKGIDLAMDAIERGIARTSNLHTHAVFDSCNGYYGDAALKIAQARRTSMAGIAGCFNASATGGMNAAKHLYKSITQPKKVQTNNEHFERVRHDNRHLSGSYHDIQGQIQYISEHH